MFDLEKSITDWQKQMLAAGIKSPVPLEELESHLREEIERQMKSGLTKNLAFEAAVQQMGQAKMLRTEFKKVERTLMKKIMMILLGIFGILVGPGLILPALAKHNNLGIWNYDIVWPIVVGAIITLAGLSIAIYGIRQRKA
jgi:hypothetical protein